MSMRKFGNTQRLPWKYVPVGGVVEVGGVLCRCVERPDVEVPLACSGCVFMRPEYAARNHCAGLKCSKWDRSDGRNVWFELASPDGK